MSTASSRSVTPRSDRVSFPRIELWNWSPLDHRPQAVAVMAATLGVGLLAWRLSLSPAMGVLSGLALAAPLHAFWLPVHYQLGSRGILRRSLGRRRLIPWSAVEECRFLPQGVVLRFRNPRHLFDIARCEFINGRGEQDRLAATIRFYRRTENAIHAD